MSQVPNEAILDLEDDAPAQPVATTRPSLRADLITLTKARLSLFTVMTTAVGFCMASHGPLDWWRLLHTIVGTALAAFGAAVLNQAAEVNVDRLMARTADRPLPTGRIARSTAWILGVGLSLAGTVWLWLGANALAAALAFATVVIYVLAYTPLKRRTWLNIAVGAVSGAIPPMIGWVAVRPSFDFSAWVLFGILFCWQMPHFLAIAWIYRDQYAEAGFVMLRKEDRDGSGTALESFIYTIALSLISVFPFTADLVSTDYLTGALVLDCMFVIFAGLFLAQRERSSARALFFASIAYLPLILGLMVACKL